MVNLTLGIPGQQFRNIPIPNFKPAIYALAIRAPTPPFVLVDGYTFPLSPEMLRKEFTSMSSRRDVQGDLTNYGVQRIIDKYGMTPVSYLIQGTTGFQFHGADGYLLSGVESLIAIEALLKEYEYLNQVQIENQLPDLYLLEFYDYYKGEYWEVVPIGRQGVSQNKSRPLLFDYSFRFDGVRPLDGPPTVTIADNLALAFSIAQSQATQNLDVSLSQIATYYSGVTFASVAP